MLDHLITWGANIGYALFKLRKIDNNKVVFISRLGKDKSFDFSMIESRLRQEHPEIQCKFLCKRIESFSKGFVGNVLFTVRCLWHLATAKVCVTDSFTVAVSTVHHKKELKVIQIWHSLAAVKKFGYQSVGKKSGRNEKTADILGMHRNYDYIVSGSKAMSKYFAEAFGYDESKFVSTGLPRIDYLINNQEAIRDKIYNVYPQLKDKINILYAPTFRTTLDNKSRELAECVNMSKFNFIVKSHARQSLGSVPGELDCKEFTTLDLLTIADYVITDYSGVAIEAASIDKDTLYYVFDYEEYKENNGLNLDLYQEMPGCVFKDPKELCSVIEEGNYNKATLRNYKDKFLEVQDGTCTEKLCALIERCMVD